MAKEVQNAKKRRYLLCINNILFPRKVEIYKDRFIVGSQSKADLMLDTNNIAKNHALIRIAGETCYIKISDPKYLTCVNSVKLIADERRALRSRDTLCFGDVLYRYVEM